MKLSDAKRKTLILMREWTNDGKIVVNTDYLKNMDDLANFAQNEIAQRAKIPKRYTLPTSGGVAYGGMLAYQMPADFVEVDRIVYIDGESISEDPYNLYLWIDRFTIGISKKATGTFDVHYFKRPVQIIPDLLNDKANDNYEFEVDEEAQDLIPFFMAAQLLMDENASLATLKLNEYQAKLEQLTTKTIKQTAVKNVTGW